VLAADVASGTRETCYLRLGLRLEELLFGLGAFLARLAAEADFRAGDFFAAAIPIAVLCRGS
jgi:hypothetical protein